MADLSRAINWLRRNGGAMEQAKLDWLLERHSPPASLIEDFLSSRNPDGGWSAFWSPAGVSSLDATCYRLAQADLLGLLPGDPRLAASLGWLASRQDPDGAWEEDPATSQAAPPWAAPGDPRARLYLTANCGFWQARFGPRSSSAVRAASLLKTAVELDGSLPSFAQTHWLTAALLSMTGETDGAERVIHYLRTRLDEFSASELAWMLSSLRGAGFPAGGTLEPAARGRLGSLQAEDGSWTSDDGPSFNIHSTLEALAALLDTDDN